MAADPFPETSMSLVEQYINLVNADCRKCTFVTESAKRASRLLFDNRMAVYNNPYKAIEELAKINNINVALTDPADAGDTEARRFLQNADATAGCVGLVAVNICSLDVSK